jgi:hypothetical protein
MKRVFEKGALIEHTYPGSSTTPNRNFEYYGALCNAPGCVCRVLVSKERLEQKWPTEKDGPEGEAFRKFAARLADAVQKALAEGVRIGDSLSLRDCRCPLGTLSNVSTHPDSFACEREGILDRYRARSFYAGFDGNRFLTGSITDSPYYRLGQAYRARFVTKGNQENV